MTGYHGPQGLQALARLGGGRVLKGQSFLLFLFGLTGHGKSNLAIILGQLISERTGVAFDVQKNLVRSLDEYKAARRVLPPGSVIIVDEAMKAGGNRRRAMASTNVELMTDVNTGRKLGHVVIVINPFSDDVDKAVLKHAHWTLRMDGVGVGSAYEIQHIGFRNSTVFEERRFAYKVPFLGDTQPEVWEAYMEKALNDERGQDVGGVEVEERVTRYVEVGLRVLRAAPEA